MSVSTHDIGLDTLDALIVDALCVFVGEDERPLKGAAGYLDWRLCGRLSRVLEGGFFSGAREDSLLLPTNGRIGTPRVFAIGLGRTATLGLDELTHALAFSARVLSQAKIQSVALELPGAGRLADEVRATALRNTFLPAFKGGGVTVLAEKSLARLVEAKS